ncbi:hypothetical protein VNI00_016559 [Paramarasmius palmivorus]|uniref:F-box protein n=1 Tax=Paramarasmius palmivorus TaxID=297713 RepID=A0AAW0BCT6_9AGAR
MANINRRLALAPAGGHSFCTALPLELLQEVVTIFVEDGGDRLTALLIHSMITHREVYKWIRITRFSALCSVHLAFQNNAQLPSYVVGMEIKLPGDPQSVKADLRAQRVDHDTDVGSLQADILKAVAPSITLLTLRMRCINPTVFHAVRTTNFPHLLFLHTSYYFSLDPTNTKEVYDEISYMHLLRLPANERCALPKLTASSVAPSWNALSRLHLQLDLNEILADQPLSANLRHLPALRELSVAFVHTANYYYVDFLEKLVVLPELRGIAVVMSDNWSIRTTVRAPYPSLWYRYHPTLVFACKDRPYFFDQRFTAPQVVAHVKDRLLIYDHSSSWDALWIGVNEIICKNLKDATGTEWPVTAMEYSLH